MAWEKAAAADVLDKGPHLFRKGKKQVAVFLAEDKVYAIDNRCPHEGYPLIEGTVDKDCQLTCNWHNWKFRLQDGECVLGSDHVRSYPAKILDEQIWVDLADPSPEEIEANILKGLKVAFHKREYGRMAREIARLHYSKRDPLLAVKKAVQWSHDKLEFGSTHCYAASADWLKIAESKKDDFPSFLACLTEAVDHMCFDSLRHPPYPFSQEEQTWDDEAFLAAVEGEQPGQAEALVLGALREGKHWKDLEPVFAQAALSHYMDFGHSLIYVYKTGQLLERLGPDMEAYLLLPLARSLAYATREDLIPEFKDYGPTLETLKEPADQGEAPELAFPATMKKALAWLSENMDKSTAATLYDRLMNVLALNLLHYDTSYQDSWDRSVSQNAGWLNLTHGVTFANAVRVLAGRYPSLWRQGLLQMACFIGRNKRYLDLDTNTLPWEVIDRDAFWQRTWDITLDHGLPIPVFSAHLAKTATAVEEELPWASETCQENLLAALNRFLNSPLKAKHVRRLTKQAVDLVKLDF